MENRTAPTPFDLSSDKLLSVAEVAALSGYSERTVRDAYKSGRLAAYQAAGRGGRVRISLSAVNAWLGTPAARTDDPAPESVVSADLRRGDPDLDVACVCRACGAPLAAAFDVPDPDMAGRDVVRPSVGEDGDR